MIINIATGIAFTRRGQIKKTFHHWTQNNSIKTGGYIFIAMCLYNICGEEPAVVSGLTRYFMIFNNYHYQLTFPMSRNGTIYGRKHDFYGLFCVKILDHAPIVRGQQLNHTIYAYSSLPIHFNDMINMMHCHNLIISIQIVWCNGRSFTGTPAGRERNGKMYIYVCIAKAHFNAHKVI